MANEEHLYKFNEMSIADWNEWREANPDVVPDLSGGRFQAEHLHQRNLHNALLTKVTILGKNLVGALIKGADLKGVDLTGVDLTAVDLTGAALKGANLSGANIKNANFFRAKLSSTKFEGVVNASKAKSLEMAIQSAELIDGGFISVKRTFCDRWLNWEIIGLAGRLPLFAASYSALILIPLFFYGLAFYNSKVQHMLDWAGSVAKPDPNYNFAKIALETLHQQPIPSHSFVFIVSTVVLAFAATIYTFACPSRVKEFTQEVWVYQFGNALIQYWPYAWKYENLRIACAVCYLFGGGGVALVILIKVSRAATFIWNNSNLPWFLS
ncbi:MAG: pentapeptide repeat-containing protein [Alphaproteobacteria bacterium]|nr:pentapeptide repeat-containing protein [Alphaproteobacteria bacterium]